MIKGVFGLPAAEINNRIRIVLTVFWFDRYVKAFNQKRSESIKIVFIYLRDIQQRKLSLFEKKTSENFASIIYKLEIAPDLTTLFA